MSSSDSNYVTVNYGGSHEVSSQHQSDSGLSDCENDAAQQNAFNDTILCIFFKGGKIGAAFYNFNTKLLNVCDEISDWGPDFYFSKSLYREVNPKFLVSFGNANDEYTKVLIDLISCVDDATTTTDSLRTLPSNLVLLPSKEYSFDICRYILTELSLASGVDCKTSAEKELYINSLINFDNKVSVYAAGALIKYLKKNWAHFVETNDGLQFFHIQQFSLNGHVLMDLTTFNALQIFHQCSHDASFKRGLSSSNREGLSIFRVFLSSCKSRMGQNYLKHLLMQPINDINELTMRMDFIQFTLHPSHQDFIESLQDNIAVFSDLSMILSKIKNTRASCRDWHVLYKAIHGSIFVSELSEPYKNKSLLLTKLQDSISSELISLENSIERAIDFSDLRSGRRPVIKMGLDESLDAKKFRRQDIGKHVKAAARIAAEGLPDFLYGCAIVYLPEMGHLIAIKEWEPNCNPDELLQFGYHFMFTLQGTIHYKNPLCQQLDETLGDINAEIIAHENRILHRLSSFVLKYYREIQAPLKILSLIDVLIAMSKVSAQNNYIRPSLNNENIHEIQDCRHPLLELVSNYECNDFYSGGNSSHIKIVTGPNGSGKTIFLKTVALTIYLAHIGSYVPAKTANIGMMHSIHTRMHSTESVSVRLSAFMIDNIQSTQALRNAHSNSLVLLDELGRGTTSDVGFSLLIGILKKFCNQGHGSPHVIVNTHYQNISKFLPGNEILEHLKMSHSEENGALTFLFKIEKGISNTFAFNIARTVGIDENIIRRAKDFLKGTNIKPIGKVLYNRPEFNMIQYLEDIELSD